MKRTLYLTLALPFLLISCQKSPVAKFSTDTVEPEVGHSVLFNNDSQNANKFEWNFGDGYASNERSPVHVFTATGPYEVILTATSKNGKDDQASMSLNVVIPTLLEIEVREYYSLDLIQNASVILYPTITDWDNQTNSIAEGITDVNGKAVFSNLDPYVYYVDVMATNYDNWTLRTEDVGFVRTPEILPHQINRFVAWVDVATHSKGAARGARELIIKKLERKATDKKQPASGGTDNWQELYNRSVKK
jgi:PKD repeat protein